MHDLMIFEPEEFMDAMEVWQAAASEPVQQAHGVFTETTDNSAVDSPFFCGLSALAEHFGNDRKKVSACAMRLMALREILKHPLAAPLAHLGPGGLQVNEAVFAVAASATLNANGGFEAEPFFRAAHELALTEEYV